MVRSLADRTFQLRKKLLHHLGSQQLLHILVTLRHRNGAFDDYRSEGVHQRDTNNEHERNEIRQYKPILKHNLGINMGRGVKRGKLYQGDHEPDNTTKMILDQVSNLIGVGILLFGDQFNPNASIDLGDLYAESGQSLQGSFSAVSNPNFASKYALESSRRDLHNALLCTLL